MRRAGRGRLLAAVALLAAVPLSAQRTRPAPIDSTTTRLAILAAEDRRAATPRDLAVLRAGARSRDAQTMRIGIRALGRLERPDVLAEILPGLKHPLPEVRSEAANAVAQALQGWARQRSVQESGGPPGGGRPPDVAGGGRPPDVARGGRPAPPRPTLDVAAGALLARLTIEADANVRAVIAEAVGRLPYDSPSQLERAERALLDLISRSQSPADRLGVANGLRATVRLRRERDWSGTVTVAPLGALALRGTDQPRPGVELASGAAAIPGDPARDARVRRLAIDALIDANAADDALVRRASGDPDTQVRRLAMKAASNAQRVSSQIAADVIRQGLADPSPMVRFEALTSTRKRGEEIDVCEAAMAAVRDPDPHVELAALDQLSGCRSPGAVALLESSIALDSSPARQATRGTWHRAAHALVSLASAAPPKASSALPPFIASGVWQLRMYAARAASALKDRASLERLARDQDDNVREAAIEGLSGVAGHGADRLYVEALERGGYQVVRAAAMALAGTPSMEAVGALRAVLRRLVLEGRDNSKDARTATTDTLQGLGVQVDVAPTVRLKADPTKEGGRNVRGVRLQPDREMTMTAADLRRLRGVRARVAIRGIGSFDLALIAAEAPVSVHRFTKLAASGYYNGLTFHRVVPNFVVQGGSPGANEYIGDAAFMRDELGQWPHVRGAVGISTRGRDTGDAQIFIDLADNPRLDHEYTVFAHVLNGMDVVDAILEGDVIERIDILPGS